MSKAKIVVDRDYKLADVDERLFSGFMEHLGDVIYGGLYDPEHWAADEDGFRGDVTELVRKLKVPYIRYPGGNFVSSFNWEDSVGPRSQRKPRYDVSWRAIESNQVGLHEFTQWLKKVDSQMMMAVNLGTRGAEDARNLIEYCNLPTGSRFSDLRAEHGQKEPYKYKLWCLGNELDGSWQMGQHTAYEYGRKAKETAKIMRQVDRDIELIAVGSSSSGLPTYAFWEDTSLMECYEAVDYISIHSYYGNHNTPLMDFVSQIRNMDLFIEEVAALCDGVQAKLRSKKKMYISFDEYNVWFQATPGLPAFNVPNPPLSDRWMRPYSPMDALFIGEIMMSLMNHSDRVKIACLSMLTSCIENHFNAADGKAFPRSMYYPFLHASQYGRGTALRAVVTAPSYNSMYYENVPETGVCPVYHEDTGELDLFLTNRNDKEGMEVELDLRAFGELTMLEHVSLFSDDPRRRDTAEHTIVPQARPIVSVMRGRAVITLPAYSYNLVRFGK